MSSDSRPVCHCAVHDESCTMSRFNTELLWMRLLLVDTDVTDVNVMCRAGVDAC